MTWYLHLQGDFPKGLFLVTTKTQMFISYLHLSHSLQTEASVVSFFVSIVAFNADTAHIVSGAVQLVLQDAGHHI